MVASSSSSSAAARAPPPEDEGSSHLTDGAQRSHSRREASGQTEDDFDDGEDADMIPLLSFTQPGPASDSQSHAPVTSLPPSYEDALELGPDSASDHHPPVRLRSLYRQNRYGASKWREIKEHLGALHHLLPEPILLCFQGTGSALARIVGGFGKRACTYLTCSCMPAQQRLSLAFAFLSFVTVLLIILQPWIDTTSGLVQGGMTPEEVSALVDRPDLILSEGEKVLMNSSWHWRRCSSEGEALRWQRKTYCTSTSSMMFNLPSEQRVDESTLEILFDRVSLETDRIAAVGKVPPGGSSSGTAPGKVEVLVDHLGRNTRFLNQIRVEILAKYDEEAKALLDKSTVVVTEIGDPEGKSLHRLRILTPTLPNIFKHDFNNVWFPHAPLQMSVKIWVPPLSQLQRNGGNDRQALPRLRIATAIADVGLLKLGSGQQGPLQDEGFEEEEFALQGRQASVGRHERRAPTSKAPSSAYFSSVHVSTLSGRVAVGANTILGAKHAIELRTYFPHSGEYADAVARAGRERANRLSSFGSLRAGRGRGQIDVHGTIVLGQNDHVLSNVLEGPNRGSVKLSTTWSTDSTITIWGSSTVRAQSLEIDADPAGVFVKKGSKFVKDSMVVKGPVKHE
ncbi:hypothetical protein CF326_g2016 [Tilletia indica]|uniref:Uncharacterized protein n=1 Tax=Tilletia indica TaxID=43049 RepID=A0A177TE79_9BASI|nr:hypothetical protein CF326_g2016 [Tilletia indica]KAE8251463.1 hypothetical protein A4X13_0g3985 [Tilletia indica]